MLSTRICIASPEAVLAGKGNAALEHRQKIKEKTLKLRK